MKMIVVQKLFSSVQAFIHCRDFYPVWRLVSIVSNMKTFFPNQTADDAPVNPNGIKTI